MLESSLRSSRNRCVISKTQKYTCAYDVFCAIPLIINDLQLVSHGLTGRDVEGFAGPNGVHR